MKSSLAETCARFGVVAFALLLSFGLWSCGREPEKSGEKTRGAGESVSPRGSDVIYTTFYPTEYFASRISGGLIQVKCPLPEDEDPIFWEPSAAIVQDYQNAGLVVVNGASFEKWIENTSIPVSRVVDTAQKFESEWVKFVKTSHSHGSGGAHTHEGTDGHTWLDPQLAKKQAEAIVQGMVRRWPSNEQAFRDNHAKLEKDLASLDSQWENLRADLGKVRVLANHPAYNYPAKRYGFAVKNLDIPPDQMPDEAAWKELDSQAAAQSDARPTIILFEAEPLEAIRTRIESQWKSKVVVFSPCESLGSTERAAGEDYTSTMKQNLERLKAALSVASGG